MLDRADEALSVRRQCALLNVARSGVYRARKPANDNDGTLMCRIDELFTAWPFLGSRRMTAMLRAEGALVNRKRVQRLMRLMGIAALGPKPRTTKPAPGHKIYPYLLRDAAIERANHVWAADITYIPIGRGFLYLVAIIDWASRAVLAWRLSNTMDVSFCLAALEEALARFGRPEIFNVKSLPSATPVSLAIPTPSEGEGYEFQAARDGDENASPLSRRREGVADRRGDSGGARKNFTPSTVRGMGESTRDLPQERFLNRQLVLPVSTISQWCVSRSSMAVVILASPNTCGQSAKARLVVISSEVFS
jgi:hypothetical protein